MEKIYEEKNKKKQQKQIKVDGTSALSFLVAIFALVSLVSFGVSGGLNTSYAVPTVTNVPPQFVGQEDVAMFANGSALREVDLHFGKESEGTAFPVYCLQQPVDFGVEETYKQGSDINDGGLIYLLANIYPNGTGGTVSGNFSKAPTDANKAYQFVSQSLIWVYLANDDSSALYSDIINTDGGLTTRPSSTTIPDSDYLFKLASGKKMFDSFTFNGTTASALLTKARSIKVGSATLNVDKASAKSSTTNDKKNILYGPITVSGSVADPSIGTYKGYKVSFNGNVPKGTSIVDESGKKLAEGTTLADGIKFYVSIPVDSVTAATTINLKIVGDFDKYSGYYYTTSEGSQEVTTVKYISYNKEDGVTINVAPAPDTGMSSAQTIYFIGLVVLLCGVGIIYANAKPSAQKQVQQEQ